MNIIKLKKLNSINKIERIEKDNIYYLDYTNYKVWIKYDCNTLELKEFLKNNNIEYIIQETCQTYIILRIKSYR